MSYIRRRVLKSKLYKPDYEFVICETIKILLILVMIGYLFFDSIAVGFIFFPLSLFVIRNDFNREKAKITEKIKMEYKDIIVCMAGNIGAGYPVEKAFIMGLRDVANQEKGKSRLESLIPGITNSLACNVSFEKVVFEFAETTGIDEIKEFLELLLASKKYGGNLVYMIRRYAGNISDRQRLHSEIETILAEKRLEGRIMLIAPFIIIIYMRLTNGEYMNILYSSMLGRMVMSISIVLMLGVNFIIEKIIRIEV